MNKSRAATWQTGRSATAVRPAAFAASAAKPRLIAGSLILLIWEGMARGFAPGYLAKPSGILLAVPKVMTDPTFMGATASTLQAVVEGLAIATVFGILIGLLLGRSVLADRLLSHYINGLYAVPMIVILPVVTLWFGYSSAARLATIVFAALFSIIINVADGARGVPGEFLEVARSFRSGRITALIEVVIPSATPYFLAGLRLAVGRALIGAVVAEFFIAIGGLGYFILYNSRTYHQDEAFVGVLLLAAFGLGFDALLNWSTQRMLPWYRRDSGIE